MIGDLKVMINEQSEINQSNNFKFSQEKRIGKINTSKN